MINLADFCIWYRVLVVLRAFLTTPYCSAILTLVFSLKVGRAAHWPIYATVISLRITALNWYPARLEAAHVCYPREFKSTSKAPPLAMTGHFGLVAPPPAWAGRSWSAKAGFACGSWWLFGPRPASLNNPTAMPRCGNLYLNMRCSHLLQVLTNRASCTEFTRFGNRSKAMWQ